MPRAVRRAQQGSRQTEDRMKNRSRRDPDYVRRICRGRGAPAEQHRQRDEG
jgi:hypothetical protein